MNLSAPQIGFDRFIPLDLATAALRARAGTGSIEELASLLDAAGFIATLQKRQGLMVACPEEIAYRQGWITAEAVQKVATQLSKNSYGQYLCKILNELNTSSQPVSLSAKRVV